ncbi:arylsulfatase [Desulfoluna butyratoxydans]|uniref:Sulfatase n-terminal n=1 Tax=Desulfoluna butyratoxydans TaxID=231438 RepID=A0A4U8YUB9_9BACT|nr:arylsulfatase [Desulfoluna butyratoxydans]VFQ47494.1 sulfatase n-terminal [Desulfoluna butyratoxydans]
MKTGKLMVAVIAASVAMVLAVCPASAAKKPNILVIMADDVGVHNVSAYSKGLVGFMTPNLDRLANEGMMFTDYYAEQSCTAGRSAFITGQSPVRTGLSKVGLPGADLGIQAEDPTLAELLKPHGYMTGQFGKNHLGDKDEFLPTAHGFDEFFGNLYHLNAEEEPEHEDYPKNPEFRKKFGPRGVIKSTADGKIEDTGPLTRKRMETVDEEFLASTKDFIERAKKADKPFFAWFNPSRMHFYTHLKKESQGVTGLGVYADGMVEHDKMVGDLLDFLKAQGLEENTIVVYTTDNGPHYNEWPDGGISPFRGEKNTNWEGGYRVPAMVRWPGKIPPGTVSNEIMSMLDWVPTLMAAVGDEKITEKLLKGHKAAGKKFKVHLDGFNFLPHITGKEKEAPRKSFFYFNDDAQLVGLRYNQWKIVFAEQRAKKIDVWQEPFVWLRAPKIFNLRSDPYERADTDSNNYGRWYVEHVFLLTPAQHVVGKFIATLKEYPPRQKPAKFNVDSVMETLYKGGSH